jgi:hypothetical protein
VGRLRWPPTQLEVALIASNEAHNKKPDEGGVRVVFEIECDVVALDRVRPGGDRDRRDCAGPVPVPIGLDHRQDPGTAPRPGESPPALRISRGGFQRGWLDVIEVGTESRPGRSLLHSRIVRGVGIHGSATSIDRLEAQFVVPGLVAVDLAQSVLSAV